MNWFTELKVDGGPPFWSLGVRHVPEEEWLLTPSDLQVRRDLKQTLWKQKPNAVYASTIDKSPSSVITLLHSWVRQHDPARALSPAFAPELVWIGQQLAEDLVILERKENGWVVIEGSLCFGFSWSISDKVGLVMDDVHTPVAHYQSEMSTPVNKLFDRMVSDRIIARRNLGLTDTSELHLSPHRPSNPTPIVDAGSEVFLRSERQTLRKIGEYILFTIHTDIAPLKETIQFPELRHSLSKWIESWDAEMLSYKHSAERTRIPTLDWLNRCEQ